MNKRLFKLHSWLALFAFVPLLVICVTGSILVFKHDIDRLLIPGQVLVDNSTVGARLDLDTLSATIAQRHHDYVISGWVFFEDQQRADLVYLIKHGTSDWFYLLLNQYTGDILAAPQGLTHNLTDWILDLHQALLMGDLGAALTSTYAVILFLLAITGFILYRKFWTRLFTLRWNSRLIVYFSDLHKMVGIFSAPLFLILSFTGGFWTISHVLHEWEEHRNGEEHPIVTGSLLGGGVSVQQLYDDSKKQLQHFEPRYLSMPYESERPLTFFGDVGSGNPLNSQYASTVVYSADVGELVSATDIRTAPLLYEIYDSFRRLHFGDFAGIGSKVVWCLAGLSPLLLSITGVTLWSMRRKKRANKRGAETERKGLLPGI